MIRINKYSCFVCFYDIYVFYYNGFMNGVLSSLKLKKMRRHLAILQTFEFGWRKVDISSLTSSWMNESMNQSFSDSFRSILHNAVPTYFSLVQQLHTTAYNLNYTTLTIFFIQVRKRKTM